MTTTTTWTIPRGGPPPSSRCRRHCRRGPSWVYHPRRPLSSQPFRVSRVPADKPTDRIPSTSPARCSRECTHFSSEEHLHFFTCSLLVDLSLSLSFSLVFSLPLAILSVARAPFPYLFFHVRSFSSLSFSLAPSPSSSRRDDVSFTRFPSRALGYRSLSLPYHPFPSLSRARHESSPSLPLSLRPRLFSRVREPRARAGQSAVSENVPKLHHRHG